MKNRLLIIFGFAVALSVNANQELGENAATDAYYVCFLMERTLEEVTEYDVNVNFTKANSVDVTMPVTASAALELCKGVVKIVHDNGATKLREGGWELRFLTPYSGDKAVARCKF